MHPWYESQETDIRMFSSCDMAYPLHLHESLEILYVERGTIRVTVGDDTAVLRPRELAVIFPHVLHGYAHADGEDGHLVHLLIAKPAQAGDYARALVSRHPRCPFLSVEELDEVPVAFRHLLRHGRDGDTPVCRAYLQLLLALLWNRLELKPNTDAAYQELTYRAVDYVNGHFCQPLSLADVSHALGLSPCQTSRLFSGRLGMGFSAYVAALRIQRAQELLARTDRPVMEIVYACGFDNPRTFNRTFLKVCGTTPRAYRQERK